MTTVGILLSCFVSALASQPTAEAIYREAEKAAMVVDSSRTDPGLEPADEHSVPPSVVRPKDPQSASPQSASPQSAKSAPADPSQLDLLRELADIKQALAEVERQQRALRRELELRRQERRLVRPGPRRPLPSPGPSPLDDSQESRGARSSAQRSRSQWRSVAHRVPKRGVLRISNKLGVDQQIFVDGQLHIVRRGMTLELDVTAGVHATQLPGQARHTWTVGPPAFSTSVDLIFREVPIARP